MIGPYDAAQMSRLQNARRSPPAEAVGAGVPCRIAWLRLKVAVLHELTAEVIRIERREFNDPLLRSMDKPLGEQRCEIHIGGCDHLGLYPALCANCTQADASRRGMALERSIGRTALDGGL